MKRIGILGGTFDPIHIGHMQMAYAAYRRLGLDTVYVIPAGYPYFKGRVTPYSLRCDMVKIALNSMNEECGVGTESGQEVFRLSLIEASEDRPAYTYETLSRIHTDEPDSKLYFICGKDVFESIDSWKYPDRVLKEASLVVFDRGGEGQNVAPINTDIYKDAEIISLDDKIISISSTEVRSAISHGVNTDKMLIPEISAFIYEHGLYQSV